MKTRTKIAVAALIGSIVVVGASLADRREHGRHHERHGGHERGAPFMEAFDLDGDGIVTQAEIEQARRERFAKFDADDDGTLTPTEYEALWLDAMRRRMQERFAQLDNNNDSVLTAEEFLTPIGRPGKRLDAEDERPGSQKER